MTESQWLPTIDAGKCTACGECIQRCPTDALGWQHEKAALTRPSLCTYCAACEDVCPVGAIDLPYLVVVVEESSRA